jgi:hypothetical protein
MQRSTATSIIYGLAAAVCSLFMLSRNLEAGGRWSVVLLVWLFVGAVPLLFVFAYPRFLFADSAPQNRYKYTALLHLAAGIIATVLFTVLSPYWKNPMRDFSDSVPGALVVLAVWLVFLLAAISLLLKDNSSLTVLASILLWPYWLLLALAFEGRWFQDSGIYAVFYFLCFPTPIFFAFAAGAVSDRRMISHVIALMGLVCTPWIYGNVMRDYGLGNVWLTFNVPDNEWNAYPPLYAVMTILFVGLIVLAVATAGLRLLPARWRFRRVPIRERTWPAIAASFIVLAVWFSQSVMPYRIPGAVDYSDYPILQILHVEKRGLQFREACVSVWGRGIRQVVNPVRVSFSGNDRRLFEYRFDESQSSGKLSETLTERVRAMIPSSERATPHSDTIKPIRNWNADAWYFNAEGEGLKAYTTANGSIPPQEIVDLFDDLEKLPHSSAAHSTRKDVCLGFCYDPLSELGFLYANHRCFNAGHGTVCR